MLSQLKTQVATYLSRHLNALLPQAIVATGFSEPANLANLLEAPKRPEHGQLALPLFSLTKVWLASTGEKPSEPPQVWVERMVQRIQGELDAARSQAGIIGVSAAGGFLNLQFESATLFGVLLRDVERDLKSIQKVGSSSVGANKRVVIDYSSPNVAKPMHVGHLRATVIGQAIRNLAETQGYEVIGLNHLGDWGVQFGKLAWAIREWGSQYDFQREPFRSLYDIYVRFHKEEAENPELATKGAETFKRLEDGDAEIEKLWRQCVDISMQEYQKVWNRLGVRHDLVRGESFYNNRLRAVEDLLSQKGLLVQSEGADVVHLGEGEPPCLIRKSDGASLYATRDLASAIYRKEELKADLNLYVVGSDQNLHFSQVFRVLALAGFEWAKDLHHISFGMYRFKDGKMSTRKGQTIFLADVLEQAVERTRELIEAKNPAFSADLKNQIAEQVGVGAVVFNDLAVDRVQNVEFDWDKILSFEGDSGPYVQYMHVRCASLFRKATDFKFDPVRAVQLASKLEGSFEAKQLLMSLLSFDEVLSTAFRSFKPNIVAQYLLQLCGLFSQFYHKNRILDAEAEDRAALLNLVFCTQLILKRGLAVLSVQAPEVM